MKFWSRLKNYLSFITVSEEGTSEKEQQYLRLRELRRFEEAGVKLIPIAGIFLSGTAIGTFLLSPEPQKTPQSITHAATGLFLLIVILLHRNRKFDLRLPVLVAQYIIALGYAWTLRLTFAHTPDINDVAFLSTIFVSAMIFNIALFPFKNGFVMLTALTHVGISVFAWSASPNLKPSHWVFVAGSCATFAMSMFYTLVYTSRSEALAEQATRQLLSQSQTNRIKTLQRDMAAAGEIQDSIAPRESIVTTNGLKISFFQIKYDLLGGDWCAVRTLDSGDLILTVADATGKGIQAALVIHSIQTLWANALSSPSFDAEDWLFSANRTLIALGQRKEHTMSLGLVIISIDTIRYYSAGHLPLFIVSRDPSGPAVQTLVARGSLLGMSENFYLVPRELPRGGMWIEALLLGTDGVFDKGSSFKAQAILELTANIRAKGVVALEDCPAQDDKLLVCVEQAA